MTPHLDEQERKKRWSCTTVVAQLKYVNIDNAMDRAKKGRYRYAHNKVSK